MGDWMNKDLNNRLLLERELQGSVKITKYLQCEGKYYATSTVFHFALFWDCGCTYRATEVLAVRWSLVSLLMERIFLHR